MALAVASQNPNMVILASRTKRKIDAIADKIQQTYPSVSVKRVQVDFASQESVRAAAADVNGSVSKLDILINNAGMMTPNRGWTKEHLELQFGTNHVGPFLFTHLLLNKMLQAASEATPGSTRIINVSSFGHRLSPIRFHDYNLEGRDIPKDEQPPATAPRHMLEGNNGYSGFIAHGQSKTANILFSVYLTHLLQSKGILSFSIHPGSKLRMHSSTFQPNSPRAGIWTGLSRDLNEEDQAAVKKTSLVWKNHDQGAATALVAAFDPSLSSKSNRDSLTLVRSLTDAA